MGMALAALLWLEPVAVIAETGTHARFAVSVACQKGKDPLTLHLQVRAWEATAEVACRGEDEPVRVVLTVVSPERWQPGGVQVRASLLVAANHMVAETATVTLTADPSAGGGRSQ